MIHFDLEQFSETGVLSPFNSQSTRAQIAEILGPPEPDSYPELALYGHLAFDLLAGVGPPCHIQVMFPHAIYMRPMYSDWTDWKPPTCFEHWPDRRWAWNLGRFVSRLTIHDAMELLGTYEECEVTSWGNGLRMLHNASSQVDLFFEKDDATNQTTLSRMAAHGAFRATDGRTEGENAVTED